MRRKEHVREKFPSFRPKRTDNKSLLILFAKVDCFLGEDPSETRLSCLSDLIGLSKPFLLRMAKDSSLSTRRISRLLLFECQKNSQLGEFDSREIEETLLMKGLNDSYFQIRMDTIRFYPGEKRKEFYTQLLNLLLSDPDRRIRQAAGERITLDFEDMLAVESNQISPLKQAFLLDSLKNPELKDELQAIALLQSEHSEAALWAARCLMRWGTLEQLQSEQSIHSEDRTMLLETATRMGILLPTDLAKSPSLKKTEPRKAQAKEANEIELNEIWEAENLILFLSNLPKNKREDAIKSLPLENENFKHWMETAFPLPDTDSRSALLYDMARVGKWTSWIPRINEALLSRDCEVRFSAVQSLFVLNPQDTVEELVHDPSEPVRHAVAHHLATLTPLEKPSKKETRFLSRYLKDSPEESYQDAVWQGIKDSGPEKTALCLINNLSTKIAQPIGNLISKGLEPQSILIIAKKMEVEDLMKDVIQYVHPKAVDFFVATLSLTEGDDRKRLLSWIEASQWGGPLLIKRFASGSFYRRTLQKQLSTLNSQEKNMILGEAVKKSRGRVRRQLKRLIKKQ